jgi:hypothetical protein
MIQPAQPQKHARATKSRKPTGKSEPKSVPRAEAKRPSSAGGDAKSSKGAAPRATKSAAKRPAASRFRAASSGSAKPSVGEPAKAHAMGTAVTVTAPLLGFPAGASPVGDVSSVQQTVGKWASGLGEAAAQFSESASKVFSSAAQNESAQSGGDELQGQETKPVDEVKTEEPVGAPSSQHWNPPSSVTPAEFIGWLDNKKPKNPTQKVKVESMGGVGGRVQKDISVADLVHGVRYQQIVFNDKVVSPERPTVLEYLKTLEWEDGPFKRPPKGVVLKDPREVRLPVEKWQPPEEATRDGLINWLQKRKLDNPNQLVTVSISGSSGAPVNEQMSIVDLMEKVRHGEASLQDQVEKNGTVLQYLKNQDWVDVAPNALSGQALRDWIVANNISDFDRLNEFLQEYSFAVFVDGNNVMPMRSNVLSLMKAGFDDVELRDEGAKRLGASWPELMLGLGSHLKLYDAVTKGPRAYWDPSFLPALTLDVRDLVDQLAPGKAKGANKLVKGSTYDERMLNAWYHALAGQLSSYMTTRGREPRMVGHSEYMVLPSGILDIMLNYVQSNKLDWKKVEKKQIKFRAQNAINAIAIEGKPWETWLLWSLIGRIMRKTAANVLGLSQGAKAKKLPAYVLEGAASNERVIAAKAQRERNFYLGDMERPSETAGGSDDEVKDVEKNNMVRSLEEWMDRYAAPTVPYAIRELPREYVLTLFDLVVSQPVLPGKEKVEDKIVPREEMADFFEYYRDKPAKLFEYLYLLAGKGGKLAFQFPEGPKVTPSFEPLDLYRAADWEAALGAADKFPSLLESLEGRRETYLNAVRSHVLKEVRQARGVGRDLATNKAKREQKAVARWQELKDNKSLEEVAEALHVHPNRLRGWIVKYLGYEVKPSPYVQNELPELPDQNPVRHA